MAGNPVSRRALLWWGSVAVLCPADGWTVPLERQGPITNAHWGLSSQDRATLFLAPGPARLCHVNGSPGPKSLLAEVQRQIPNGPLWPTQSQSCTRALAGALLVYGGGGTQGRRGWQVTKREGAKYAASAGREALAWCPWEESSPLALLPFCPACRSPCWQRNGLLNWDRRQGGKGAHGPQLPVSPPQLEMAPEAPVRVGTASS